MAYLGELSKECRVYWEERDVKNCFEERRFGKFRLSQEFFRGELSQVKALFRDLLVLRAENDFASMSVEYTVTGDMLDPIGEGSIPPEYEVVISPSGIELVREDTKKPYVKRKLLVCKW